MLVCELECRINQQDYLVRTRGLSQQSIADDCNACYQIIILDKAVKRGLVRSRDVCGRKLISLRDLQRIEQRLQTIIDVPSLRYHTTWWLGAQHCDLKSGHQFESLRNKRHAEVRATIDAQSLPFGRIEVESLCNIGEGRLLPEVLQLRMKDASDPMFVRRRPVGLERALVEKAE